MTSWKKLLVGGASGALVVGWMVSLTDCTVCSGPQCFNNEGGTGSDSATEGGGDGGGTDSGATCPGIKPQGPIFFDNTMGTGTCDKCMTAKCCTETTACAVHMPEGSMDNCQDYLSCLDACADPDGGAIDPQCAAACGQTDPMGKSVADTMFSCLNSKCMTECQ